MKKYNVKRTAVLLTVLLAITAGACGRRGSGDGGAQNSGETIETVHTLTDDIDQTPVTLHVYNTLRQNSSMENIENYIHQTMPNVTIESIYENGSKAENAQLAEIKNGGGPEILYTQNYYTYVHNGYLVDLTSETFLKNYMTSALNEIEVGGKVYALPIGNGSISGLAVNVRLLKDLGYEMPETQDEFIEICRLIQARQEETGIRAYAFNMLYSDSSALVAMPFLLDAYSNSEYVKWLTQYRNDPSSVSFDTPAYSFVLERLNSLKDLGLYKNGDFLTNSMQNLQEILQNKAVMASVSYSVYKAHFQDKLADVDGVTVIQTTRNGQKANVPASDFVFVPYFGNSKEDRWIATNGDWYLGINSGITDEATMKACRLFLEYVASTEFAPEIYGTTVPDGTTTYYRRNDALQYDAFKDTLPELYQCLTENSIIKNPYQFYGSSVFTFAQQHFLCNQKYYAGLSGSSSYLPIGGTDGILSALEEFRTTGNDRYEVPDNVVGKTDKAYRYMRIYSRSNESALGNLLADALREYTGADLAVINAGSLTAGLQAGEITESDLASAMLYGLSNHIVTLECKGENLISILSTNNVTKVIRDDETGVFGGLVLPSGFTYTISYDSDGSKYGSIATISDVCLLNGEPIDPKAYYTVTTTDYELGGADEWNAIRILPNDKPDELPDGVFLYHTFDSEDESRNTLFELNLDTYEEDYKTILSWAQEQPNIVDAVLQYIEDHSENGVLTPVTLDGRIRIINMPSGLDPVANGVDLG